MSLIEQAVARIHRAVDDATDVSPRVESEAPPAAPPASNGARPSSPVTLLPARPNGAAQATIDTLEDADRAATADRIRARPGVPAIRQLPMGTAIEFPVERLRERGFVTPDTMATATGFEFRVLAQTVREAAIRPKREEVRFPQRVMMTSAVPGEGKTFCALNLAIGLAIASEHPVVFVDGDVVRRSATSLLGLSKSKGTMEFLKGVEPIASKLVRPTQFPNLKLLPAGTTEEQAGRLLATKPMEALLEQLSVDFPTSIIVIDAPPLLAVTECRVLAQYIGQVLVVVAAGETPRSAVDEALASLEDIDGVSLILNKTSASQAKNRSYYEY